MSSPLTRFLHSLRNAPDGATEPRSVILRDGDNAAWLEARRMSVDGQGNAMGENAGNPWTLLAVKVKVRGRSLDVTELLWRERVYCLWLIRRTHRRARREVRAREQAQL